MIQQAKWIAPAGAERFKPCHFRVEKTLVFDSIPASLVVQVTCDGTYLLEVNGQRVGRGPARGTRQIAYYDEYDVAPLLHAGANRFSVLSVCMNYPAEGWHLMNDQILDDPATDFQISPFNYGADFRALGRSGHVRSLADSYRARGKLCILESDTRTHLEPNTGGHTFATNEEESIALLARDIASCYSHGTGMWFMDFSNCWYMTPGLQDFFLDMRRFIDRDGDFSSVAEVAVVGDFESVPFHAIESNPNTATYSASVETPRELAHCQVPYDMLSFGDLSKPGAREYKVYVFLNNYLVTPARREVIDSLKKNGHYLVWAHLPGYFTADSASLENTERLTGFRLAPVDGELEPRLLLPDGASAGTSAKVPFAPAAQIADETAETLGRLASKERQLPAAGIKRHGDWTGVLCTSPYLPRQLLGEIFRRAGIFRYCDTPDAMVYANASMVMLHTGRAGRHVLHWPAKAKWTQFFPERKTMAADDTLEFDAKAHTTYFFALQEDIQ